MEKKWIFEIFWDFFRFSDFWTIFDNFLIFLFFFYGFFNLFLIFWVFLDFLDFFWIFWIFWTFFGFGDFLKFFEIFWIFFVIVINVTTKCYHGYYWTPKMGQNSIKSPLFARRAKKTSAEGRSPPQELEVGPRSGPYLLVYLKRVSEKIQPVLLVLLASPSQF